MEGISIHDRNYTGSVTGVSVEINHAKISHVNTLLQSTPQKALTVYRRAIGRALRAGETQAKKEIHQRYDIPMGNLGRSHGHTYHTFSKRVMEDSGGVSGYIYYSGAKIPLYRFHPVPKERKYTTRYVNDIGGWRVTTDVSAADIRGHMLRHKTAFIATMQSGHTGIFMRKNPHDAHSAIRELWGFAVQDMLDYHEARENIKNRMAEIVEQSINHELLRALDEK